MDKDFDKWNIEKKRTHKENARYYTVREIWWCRLGINIGSEQDGSGEKFLRPVIVVQSFGSKTCLIVPLTTSAHHHTLRIPIGIVDGKNATALLSQIRVIDTRRLIEKITFLDKENFEILRKAIKDIL